MNYPLQYMDFLKIHFWTISLTSNRLPDAGFFTVHSKWGFNCAKQKVYPPVRRLFFIFICTHQPSLGCVSSQPLWKPPRPWSKPGVPPSGRWLTDRCQSDCRWRHSCCSSGAPRCLVAYGQCSSLWNPVWKTQRERDKCVPHHIFKSKTGVFQSTVGHNNGQMSNWRNYTNRWALQLKSLTARFVCGKQVLFSFILCSTMLHIVHHWLILSTISPYTAFTPNIDVWSLELPLILIAAVDWQTPPVLQSFILFVCLLVVNYLSV